MKMETNIDEADEIMIELEGVIFHNVKLFVSKIVDVIFISLEESNRLRYKREP